MYELESYLLLIGGWRRLNQLLGKEAKDTLKERRTRIGITETEITKAEQDTLQDDYPKFKEYLEGE